MSRLLSSRGNTTLFLLVSLQLRTPNVSCPDVLTAKRCNERGEFLASDMPSTLPMVRPATDWSPFNSCIGFELADLIFAEAELSRKKADHLLQLWTASLVPHGVLPPITDYTDLLRQVNSIPLRDIPWESFCLRYDDPPPMTTYSPEWKTAEYEVWYRNPQEVIKGILSNPEFDSHIDYSAYREFEGTQRWYSDMMSGNWSWGQSVRHTTAVCFFCR